MKNSKRWIIFLLIATIFCTFVFAGITYMLDPFMRYGENGILTKRIYAEMYSNPGIARNYDYDAVLVGTSMIEGTDIEECNEMFDCNMVRLCYSGGTAHNMKRILDICFEHNEDVRKIYWELDEFQLFADADTTRYPLPEYLYREDHVQDLSYLLNIDIFYHYTLKDLWYTMKGIAEPPFPMGSMWDESTVYSKDVVLEGVVRQEKQIFAEGESLKKKVRENLDQNIIPLVEQNPDTEFHFFMVPFSIMYWYNVNQKGRTEAEMDAVKVAMEELLQFDNVFLYFYHDEEDIITNLDNYKDYSHYGPWINSWVTKAVAEEKSKITLENYEEVVDRFRDYVEDFDYDIFWQQ